MAAHLDLLLRAPELAVLDALEATLAASALALTAAHPEVEGGRADEGASAGAQPPHHRQGRARAQQGDTGGSVFLFHGKPGSGPGPHRHPYDEIQFIREGRGVWTVNGNTFEGGAGDIFVIKAGEIHSFKAIGDSPLVQLDVHLSPRFIQENL